MPPGNNVRQQKQDRASSYIPMEVRMKALIKCWCAAAAVAIIAGSASADEKTVTLARTYKEGDKVSHKMTVNVSVNGMEVTVTRTAKSVVKEIKKTGEAVIVQTDDGSTLNIGGMEQQQPAGPPVTEIRDKNGKLTEIKMDEAAAGFMTNEIQILVAKASDVQLSDKPVKAGDSWQNEFDNPAVKGKKVVAKTTYVGLDKLDGTDRWKIKQTVEADSDADGKKLSIEITAWLDTTNGRNVKLEGSAKDIPTNFGVLSWTMKQEVVKEAAK
jgi:hypothetical protein